MLIVLSFAAAAPALAAETAAPATPVAPPPSSDAPVTVEKQYAVLKIESMKPTLSARNVYSIKGTTANGVAGGWVFENSYKIDEATKVVQVTLSASAPKSSPATKAFEPFTTKVEIKELAGPAYSGKPGKYDVVVVDQTGKELTRTVYEIKGATGSGG